MRHPAFGRADPRGPGETEAAVAARRGGVDVPAAGRVVAFGTLGGAVGRGVLGGGLALTGRRRWVSGSERVREVLGVGLGSA